MEGENDGEIDLEVNSGGSVKVENDGDEESEENGVDDKGAEDGENKPLIDGEEGSMKEPEEDGVGRDQDCGLGRRIVLVSCLVVYISLWVLVYAGSQKETKQGEEGNKRFIEALYFILITNFTVGFGDIHPASIWAKWVSIVLILVGFGFVDFGSNMVLNWMISKLEIHVLGRRVVLTVKWKKAICAIIAIVVCVLVTTIGAASTQRLSKTEAVYLATSSLTTLGYGDLSFKTDRGMAFCVIWLPFGILITSKALLCLAQLGFSWCRLGICEKRVLFTSESVTEAHPDKICDQLVDAIVDVCLEKDPESRVLCEACVDSGIVTVFGKVKMKENFQEIIHTEIGCPDEYVINNQIKFVQEFEATYQGSVFGYATDETPQLMPLSHVMATKLASTLTEAIKKGSIPWLKPGGKVEVTVEYRDDNGAMVPVRVHRIFISNNIISTEQHKLVSNHEVRKALITHVIEPAIPHYRDVSTRYNLPSRLVTSEEGVGLSGRRFNADTYGGWGATLDISLSGKDPNHVERYGAYIARKAAKSVVGSGLARRCCIQLSYKYGHPKPSVHVDTFSTGIIPDKDIISLIEGEVDFTHSEVISGLDLKRGKSGGKYRYRRTATYGHFGCDSERDPINEGQDMFPDFTWENKMVLMPQSLRERLRAKT